MKIIELEITGREAYLIKKYGYPFEAEKDQLEKISQVEGWHKFNAEPFYIEHIIGDLSRSMREIRSQRLIEEIDSICDMLEMSLSDTMVLIK